MATNFGKLNFSTSFNPTAAFPLDARCYFESLADAQAAALTAEEAGSSNTVYFFGQQIAVVENNAATLYIIDKEAQGTEPETYKGVLKEVGSKTLGDGNSIDLVDGELTLVGFADAENKNVPHKDTTTGKIVWGPITDIIPGAITPVTDGETIAVAQDPSDTSKYIISIKGKAGALDKAVLRKHIAEDETVTYTWDVIYSAAEVDALLENKVDKETGKSLVSDTEINKLAGVSEGANKVEASETNGNIKIDGTETVVYKLPDGIKAITVDATNGVSDGTNTYKYDDSALAGRVDTIEGKEAAWDAKQDALAFEGTYNKETNKVVTKSALDDAIKAISQFQYKVVDTLPEAKKENIGIIFLYKPEGATSYEEYIVVNTGTEESPAYSLEKIGDTDIKLADYYNKKATDDLLKAKVDVVEGKTLTSNDFTDELKSKLDGIAEEATKVVASSTNGYISINGASVQVYDDSAKQDKIDDLDTIRSGAALGATAVQPAALTTYATIGYVDAQDAKKQDLITEENKLAATLVSGLDVYATVTYVDTEVAKKQNVIDADNKLSADLIANGTVNYAYTKAESEKLANIAEGAQVNVLEAVKVNGATLAITDKAVNVEVPTGALASLDKVEKENLGATLTAEIDAKLDASALTTYATIAYVDTQVAAKQDVIDADHKLAATLVDGIDAYATLAYVDEELAKKQDKLAAGAGINATSFAAGTITLDLSDIILDGGNSGASE